MTGARLREIRPQDAHALYAVFRHTLATLVAAYGDEWLYDESDDAATWPRWEPLYARLQATCDRAWLAEVDGAVVGYARSLRRGDVRELTEFFVRPDAAGEGIGRRLLEAAFPREAGVARLIIATGDPSAQSRYIRHGFRGHTSLAELRGPCVDRPVQNDLVVLPVEVDDPSHLDQIGAIDDAVLGTRRDDDQRWYARARTGRRFLRDGRAVGYGWVGSWAGPVAALDPEDLPAMLAELERVALALGVRELTWNVPTLAQPAAAHLLERGYRLDRLPVTLMSDGPELPGAFDRYVVTTPPFFL